MYWDTNTNNETSKEMLFISFFFHGKAKTPHQCMLETHAQSLIIVKSNVKLIYHTQQVVSSSKAVLQLTWLIHKQQFKTKKKEEIMK